MPGRLLPFVRSNTSSLLVDGHASSQHPTRSASVSTTISTNVGDSDGRRQSENKSPTRASKTMDQLRRHSKNVVASKHGSKGSSALHHGSSSNAKDARKASPSPARPVQPQNSLSMVFESPPNIFYGPASSSTGALFSGRLKLSVVTAPELALSSFTMVLLARVTTRRPVVKDCPDCAVSTTELHKWTFIRELKHFHTGTHEFPFSYLLPGHLPVSTNGGIGKLEYVLEARALSAPAEGSSGPGSSGGETIELSQPLPIYRAMQPAADKDSLRLFPPTNLTARITMAPIIHPIGDFNVLVKLDGVVSKDGGAQTRWRLRKMMWKLEEMEKMISPACSRHTGKLGGEGKGIKHDETRVIGQEELKDGWKTDFSNSGTVELEFRARALGTRRPLCDVDSPTGLVISHQLVIELVVAEEVSPVKFPDRSQPTGAARVLRMTLPVQMMERVGMGISWDEEQPPMYEDVPASPPMYAQGSTTTEVNATVHDYTGPPLSPPPTFELTPEIDRLHLGEPSHSVPNQSLPAAGPLGASTRQGRLSAEDLA